MAETKTVLVNESTLDEITSQNNLNPDFIKVDTQGTELDILKNADNAIKECLMIESEAEIIPMYSGQSLFHDVSSFLYEKDFQLFLDYNIQDTELIEKLDGKLKLMEIGLSLAYFSKVNFEDIFSPMRYWENIIQNYLFEQGIVNKIAKKKNSPTFLSQDNKSKLSPLSEMLYKCGMTCLSMKNVKMSPYLRSTSSSMAVTSEESQST